MEDLLLDILARLRALGRPLDAFELERVMRKHNTGISDSSQHLTKRKLLPWYQRVRREDHDRWLSWGIDPTLEQLLIETLRMKPRRTTSGVATITVLTRPWPCHGTCVFCPADVRMPKSYLHDEPACQRAEHNFFDPYLQVALRLRALEQMGHPIDKVELIVLGGTWSDYPEPYQIWFVSELFRALNDWPVPEEALRARYQRYRDAGLTNDGDALAQAAKTEQDAIDRGATTYNDAIRRLYGGKAAFQELLEEQKAGFATLEREQQRNEQASSRVVGLVVETRPDSVTPEALTLCRRLGCTKIQIGIQSTRQEVLDRNYRGTTTAQVERAIALIRLYGFKIHTHLMVNLMGSTPEGDKADFRTFVSDPAYLPDEIKLYPCVLVEGTGLMRAWRAGDWQPYDPDDLVDILVADTLAAPPYVRISRMIRDISSTDIVAGNKHPNLRQLVEQRIREAGEAGDVREMRFREIAGGDVDMASLALDDYSYETAVSHEHFLQWVTPEGRLAGFCRLSLPKWDLLTGGTDDGTCGMTGGSAGARREAFVSAGELPTSPGEAMIREVHVYGEVAHLGGADAGAQAQHHGLGRALIERACEIAREAGYRRINVISSVGTREYYRHLGFQDGSLYQWREL